MSENTVGRQAVLVQADDDPSSLAKRLCAGGSDDAPPPPPTNSTGVCQENHAGTTETTQPNRKRPRDDCAESGSESESASLPPQRARRRRVITNYDSESDASSFIKGDDESDSESESGNSDSEQRNEARAAALELARLFKTDRNFFSHVAVTTVEVVAQGVAGRVTCPQCPDAFVTKVTATKNRLQYECTAMHVDTALPSPPILRQLLGEEMAPVDATNAYSVVDLKPGCSIGESEQKQIRWHELAWPCKDTLTHYAKACPDVFTDEATANFARRHTLVRLAAESLLQSKAEYDSVILPYLRCLGQGLREGGKAVNKGVLEAWSCIPVEAVRACVSILAHVNLGTRDGRRDVAQMINALSQDSPPAATLSKACKLCAKYGDAILRSPRSPNLGQFAPLFPAVSSETAAKEPTEKSLPPWLLYPRRLASNATRLKLSPNTATPKVTLPPDGNLLCSLLPSVSEADEERMSEQSRRELDEVRRTAVEQYVNATLEDGGVEEKRLERIQVNMVRICNTYNANGLDPALLVPVVVDGGVFEYHYALLATCPTQKDQLMRQRADTNTTKSQLSRSNQMAIMTVNGRLMAACKCCGSTEPEALVERLRFAKMWTRIPADAKAAAESVIVAAGHMWGQRDFVGQDAVVSFNELSAALTEGLLYRCTAASLTQARYIMRQPSGLFRYKTHDEAAKVLLGLLVPHMSIFCMQLKAYQLETALASLADIPERLVPLSSINVWRDLVPLRDGLLDASALLRHEIIFYTFAERPKVMFTSGRELGVTQQEIKNLLISCNDRLENPTSVSILEAARAVCCNRFFDFIFRRRVPQLLTSVFLAKDIPVRADDPVDTESRDYLFDIVGRALHSGCLGRVLMYPFGSAGCGKSTVMNLLKEVLGDEMWRDGNEQRLGMEFEATQIGAALFQFFEELRRLSPAAVEYFLQTTESRKTTNIVKHGSQATVRHQSMPVIVNNKGARFFEELSKDPDCRDALFERLVPFHLAHKLDFNPSTVVNNRLVVASLTLCLLHEYARERAGRPAPPIPDRIRATKKGLLVGADVLAGFLFFRTTSYLGSSIDKQDLHKKLNIYILAHDARASTLSQEDFYSQLPCALTIMKQIGHLPNASIDGNNVMQLRWKTS